MKKLFYLFVGLLCLSCSGSDDTVDDPSPSGSRPTLSLTVEKAGGTSCRLRIETDATDGRYGYLCRTAASDETLATPEAGDLLLKSAPIDREATFELTGLEPESEYVVYAVVGSGDMYSNVGRLSFSTLSGPSLTLAVEETGDTFCRIRIETDATDGRYGYLYRTAAVDETLDTPEAEALLLKSAPIDREATVELTGLEAKTKYVVYAVVSDDGGYSDVGRLEFTATSVQVVSDGMIEMLSIGSTSFSFAVHGGTSRYLFYPIEKPMYDMGAYSPAAILSMFGYVDEGENRYDWIDGELYYGYYDAFEMSVLPDCEYLIFVALCDDEENPVGEVQQVEFKTEPNPQSDAKVSIRLSEITSTSVRISAVPDERLSKYYVYVRDKAWYDGIFSGYGESMVIRLIQYTSDAKIYTGASNDVWENLAPSTDYYCGVVGIDSSGAESLVIEEFRTETSSGRVPTLDIGLAQASSDPHETLSLSIKSDIAYLIRYYLSASADVWEAQQDGKSYEDLINDEGTDLSTAEVAEANGSGFRLDVTELWPEAEYTLIVTVRSSEGVETTRTAVCNTASRPAVAQVSSDLFDVLPGRWALSYSFVDYSGRAYTVSNAEVEIAAGADARSAQDYRARNRLVVLGYQFLSTWQSDPWPYYSPSDLMEYPYWGNYPELAYRDYGPHFFLEIGEGDRVTVPTARNEYLMGWVDNGPVNFFGCDYNMSYIAPATFPVEISEDRNTITIGQCVSGAEFYYGVYRPAVFIGTTMYNVATSDLVLRRIDSRAKPAASAASRSAGNPASRMPGAVNGPEYRWVGERSAR